MTRGHVLRHVDYVLLAAVAGAIAFSLVTISSTASGGIVQRQVVYVGVGVMLALAVALLDARTLRALSWWAYGGLLLLLLVVLGVGQTTRGASRWIPLPGFQLQPSEMGKVVVAVVLATYVARRKQAASTWHLFVRGMLIAAVPAGLVFLEPDLGTAIVYTMLALALLFVGGARLRHLIVVLAIAAVAVVLAFRILPALGLGVLKPYQETRLTAFLDPASSSVAAYQSHESRVAIGSGGLVGRGVRGAGVTRNNFLPEHHTDFIFSVVGEQRGFVGTAALLALLAVIVWRAIRTVTLAATLVESLIAAGLAGMLLTQVFVNVGMTIGIMPTTGIPLPFVTYGGSNTVANLVAVGLLCGIQLRGALPEPPPLADHELVRHRSSALRWSDV
jgi:rod shape determining protein RodA